MDIGLLAVAGFSEADLLVVSGKLSESEEITYIHRGIAGRAFERRFELADHVKVTGANLVNGLLQIELMREVPEEKNRGRSQSIRSPFRTKSGLISFSNGRARLAACVERALTWTRLGDVH